MKKRRSTLRAIGYAFWYSLPATVAIFLIINLDDWVSAEFLALWILGALYGLVLYGLDGLLERDDDE